MKEASRVKYYFAKYFFLALGLLQWFIGCIIFLRNGDLPRSQFAVFTFFTLGLVCVSTFVVVASKIKRVAISKKKVAIINSYKIKEYEWPEIKSITFLPIFNMYRMKIRGKKRKIYFLPTDESEVIYGIFSAGQLSKGLIMRVGTLKKTSTRNFYFFQTAPNPASHNCLLNAGTSLSSSARPLA